MFESFFVDNTDFQRYSAEHLFSVLFWVIAAIVIFWYSKKYLSEKGQIRFITLFTIFLACSQLAKVVIKLSQGVFDPATDLPLHLCNIMPFILPWALYFKNRTAWSVVFIWIMIGTFQANFTPTLKQSFPHYESIRYWIIHCGLVIAALYPAILWGFKIKWKDLIRSLFFLNILALIIYPINLYLGSNYLYLMGKPEGKTFFSLLGPWPYYLLVCELMFFVLAIIVCFPFLFGKKEPNTPLEPSSPTS